MSEQSIAFSREYLAEMSTELNSLAELDVMEMYRTLSNLGDSMEPFPADRMDPEHKVPGCISNVYIHSELEDGRMHYWGASESHVVRGYVAILVRALSGLRPEEAASDSRDIIEEFARTTNIRASLTPNRANAFANIYGMMIDQAASLTPAG